MKVNYLFPNRYKRIGWFILIPSISLGMLTLINDYEPDFLDFNVPAFFITHIFGDKTFFSSVENNLLNELLGVLVIISSLLVAFSKEKIEDEYISKVRLESLVWAVYFNYGILLISFIFIYDMSFLWVMILNMFTVLLFFIVRFNWQISKIKKITAHAE